MNETCLAIDGRIPARVAVIWYSEHLISKHMDANGVARTPVFTAVARDEGGGRTRRQAGGVDSITVYGVPFLLENPAHYLPDLPADPENWRRMA